MFEYDKSSDAQVDLITATQTIGPLQAVENSDVLAINYEGKKFTVGYIERRGNGRIVVIGLDPNPALILAIHRYLNIPTYARSDASGVHTGLLKGDSAWYLTAANLAKEERRTLVTFDGRDAPSGKCRVTDMWDGTTEEVFIEDKIIVFLDGKSGNVWKIETV